MVMVFVHFLRTQNFIFMRMLFAFNLNRTMPDVVMRQFMFDAVGDLFGLCNRHVAIYDNMAGQNVDIAGNRPNMQVVNGFYALHIPDNAEQLIGMDVFRRAFHQNVQSLFKQLPAAAPYQSRHQYAGNRIRPLPAIAIISTAATIAPIEPNKSLITCRYAPRILTFSSVSLFFNI